MTVQWDSRWDSRGESWPSPPVAFVLVNVRHDPDDARGWLRMLAAMTEAPVLRVQLDTAADHWRDLAPELRADLADAWHAAELEPKYRGRRPVEPGQ